MCMLGGGGEGNVVNKKDKNLKTKGDYRTYVSNQIHILQFS